MVKDALFGLEMNSPEFFDKEPMHHGLMPGLPFNLRGLKWNKGKIGLDMP